MDDDVTGPQTPSVAPHPSPHAAGEDEAVPASVETLTPRQIAARKRKRRRRVTFTPAGLADLRRIYEETPQRLASVAASFGMSEPTLRRIATDEGWTRYAHPPIDVSPAARLAASAAALAQSAEAGQPVEAAFWEAWESLLRQVQRLVVVAEAACLQMQETGDFTKSAQLARDASSLTTTLQRLKIMRPDALPHTRTDQHAPESPDHDTADLDAFRDRLAHTIDTLVDEWLHADDAGPSRREDPVPDRT